jgi:hypothetical protein
MCGGVRHAPRNKTICGCRSLLLERGGVEEWGSINE